MRHVYVHVPFCARRCVYCDFAIAVRRRVPGERYVAAVFREHELRRRQQSWDEEPLITLYLGGGTPSLLPPEHVARLVDHLLEAEGANRSDPDFEVTLEANPDDVTPEAVSHWVAAGVTRVSLGVQSFDQHVLEWMHRTHTAHQSQRAARTLRDGGVESISLDLIFGLPAELGGDLRRDLDAAVRLSPDHLSVYGLTVERRTPLGRWVARGSVRTANDERFTAEFLTAHDVLTDLGFEHYEVSNYARPGCGSRHNDCYWGGRPYGGLGPSAHSYANRERRWNVRELAAYERALAEGGDPIGGREEIDEAKERLERLYLGLRTARGVPADQLDCTSATVRAAGDRGWLEQVQDCVRLTPSGWLRLDELATALTTSAKGG
jgi:oxygen-independent coproporphyrinogen-3 oxidase